MKTFDRHIFRHVLLTACVVLLAFSLLISVFALIDELKGEYSFADAAWYVLLTTPRRVYELLPFVVFLGVLISLGSLANNSELVVIRAAGMSTARLFGSVCIPALTLLGAGAAVGEYVAPQLEESAEAYKTKVRYESDTVQIYGGYWYREGGLYMTVDAVRDDGELLNVRQYWRDDAGLLERTVAAASASYVPAEGHWLLRDVTETVLLGDRTRTRQSEQEVWTGQVNPAMLSVRVLVDPPKLGMAALIEQIRYMQREGLNANAYEVAFYNKAFMPLGVLGLCLLALAFVLGPMRQMGFGVRLSIGVIAGLIFKYLQDLFAPMSQVYDLSPAVAVLVPIVVCWLVAGFGIRRFS